MQLPVADGGAGTVDAAVVRLAGPAVCSLAMPITDDISVRGTRHALP